MYEVEMIGVPSNGSSKDTLVFPSVRETARFLGSESGYRTRVSRMGIEGGGFITNRSGDQWYIVRSDSL